MSPSWISQPQNSPGQPSGYSKVTMPKPESRGFLQHSKRFWFILCGVLLALAIGLGVGLGVGLTQGGDDSGSASPTPTPTSTPSANSTGLFWKPTAGTSWQIVLLYALNDTSPNVDVYDIDLFDNTKETFDGLHAQKRKVICYFSAGSYEDNRPDSAQFTAADKGKELDGWPGEYWLNTKSTNVRNIMTARLKLAASQGCDGVDPDNIDGYDNETGLSLTTDDAVDYLTFLSNGAHALNMSIGLKNGGAIVNRTIDMMQWQVNEQCEQYNECDLFRPFINANKPVFHIEYPDSAPDISASTQKSICDNPSAAGFSTLLKNMDLDNFLEAC